MIKRAASTNTKIISTSMPLTHIDCFAGPGGLCTGFKAAGIRTELAIEKVQSCADTYSANRPEIPVICKDIRDVTAKDISGIIKGHIDILSSGMPCETFSTAGSNPVKWPTRNSSRTLV